MEKYAFGVRAGGGDRLRDSRYNFGVYLENSNLLMRVGYA